MRKAALVGLVVTATLGAASSSVRASTPTVTVPAPADLVVEADWTPVLGDIADMNSVNCRDGATTHKSVKDLETALSSNPVRLLNVVSLECKPTLAVEGKVVTLTGTAKSDSLGFSDGVFNLKCSFRSNLSVTVGIDAGLKVPTLIAMKNLVSSQLPVACSFTATSAAKGASLSGTIEGLANVGSSASKQCAASAVACVPFSLDSVNVTITDTTGSLDGLVGSGTYSYADTFQLEGITDIVDKFTATKKALGLGIRNRPQVDPDQGAMKLTFAEGSGKSTILRPAPLKAGGQGIVTAGEGVHVATVAGAKCSITLSNGARKSTLTATAGADGVAIVNYSAVKLKAEAKKIGAVKRGKTLPSVTATAACTSGTTVIPAVSEKVQLAI